MIRQNTIIIVDDDTDDRLVINEALLESGLFDTIENAVDGDDLLKLLIDYQNRQKPLPSLILMDINMPKRDGKEILKEIRSHQLFNRIPVVIYSTSQSQKDINDSYEFGANSYIIKPTSYEQITEIVKLLSKYWIDTASLPGKTHQ